jgi:small subunit ribosomal protein S13
MFGLKVRGQRTRCTGRKGGAVGVAKGGRVLPAQAGGTAGAPAAEGVAAEGVAAEGAPAAAEGKGSTVATKPGVENKQVPKTEKKEAPATKKT